MSVVWLIIILVVLIVVHEFGHFIAAKKAGIRVDEFGLGYPPRLWGKRYGETLYSINLLPFGGFVKIFGEEPDQESISGPESVRSFVNKSKWVQLMVLSAGIFFNILFGWLVISLGYMIGLPSSTDNPIGTVSNAVLTVAAPVPGSPAEKAGIMSGDVIESIAAQSVSAVNGKSISNPTKDDVVSFVKAHQDESIAFTLKRGKTEITKNVIPASGIVDNQKAVGIDMDMIGTLHLSVPQALWAGLKTTLGLLSAIIVGLYTLVHDAILGKGALSQVTGPVGIAGLVGQASQLGFVYLMTFTAFISLNLAVINLIPFPALDGGRILFVIIEAVRRKPIRPNVANAFNMIGFAILILLMVVVTYHDIAKLLIK